MELDEKYLENIMAGFDNKIAGELDKDARSLYRRQAIESLKSAKQKILNSKANKQELTEEELENVIAGIRR